MTSAGHALAEVDVHPAADVFPLLEGDELEDLVTDIRDHGQVEPIVYVAGKLIDGRNRVVACHRLGIKPRAIYLREPRSIAGEPMSAEAYVVARNVRRRHLTASQRAMYAMELLPDLRQAARERMNAGNPGETLASQEATPPNGSDIWREGYSAGIAGRDRLTRHASEHELDETEDAEWLSGHEAGAARRRELQAATGKATEQAAAQVGVSRSSVERAVTVVEKGVPELAGAVRGGAVTVKVASDLAHLPADAQREVLEAADPEVLRKVAKEQRVAKQAARKAKADSKAAEQAARAQAASPRLEGIDLRCCRVEEMLDDIGKAGAAIVQADPPWKYNQSGNGAAANHYETLEMHVILEHLDKAYDAVAPDAIMLCWCTGPILHEFITATNGYRRWRWGPVVTVATWTKSGNIGNGWWWRTSAELLLLFTRGSPAVLETIRNTYHSARLQHSEKPEAYIRELLEAFSPPGSLVVDLYAGLAPVARACVATRRRYVGAESCEARHALAQVALAEAVPNPEQLELMGGGP